MKEYQNFKIKLPIDYKNEYEEIDFYIRFNDYQKMLKIIFDNFNIDIEKENDKDKIKKLQDDIEIYKMENSGYRNAIQNYQKEVDKKYDEAMNLLKTKNEKIQFLEKELIKYKRKYKRIKGQEIEQNN